MIEDSLLSFSDRAILTLRGLFAGAGYRPFKMSKFEEYDLYSKNKEFLVSDGVIAFNDTNGKLMALKPDVTLSIIKNAKDTANLPQKYYYNENVYRMAGPTNSYREIMQTGVECIGKLDKQETVEVTALALKSLAALSPRFLLQLADVSLLRALLADLGIEEERWGTVLAAIAEKNTGSVKPLLSEGAYKATRALIRGQGGAEETLSFLSSIARSEKTKALLQDFGDICRSLFTLGFSQNLSIDFSIACKGGYYSGLVFRGFINGLEERVLAGGRYDNLVRKMGKNGGAIGFAFYLDALERLQEKTEREDGYLNIALPKGRLGETVYGLFERAGFDCPAIKETNRKLIFENREKKLRFFWVKPSDVTIYVERGSADIGVAGKDILLEYQPDVFELLDLRIGKCRMAVAAKKDFCDDESKTLRVATKFSRIAKHYYAKKCRDIDIIHLNGSIELAPILGLSDVIVDIVETGKTLLENDLIPFETVAPISARLIANKASFGFKAEKIEAVRKALSKEVPKDD